MYVVLITACIVGILAGMSAIISAGTKKERTFLLDSYPSGMTVYFTNNGTAQKLGVTPLVIEKNSFAPNKIELDKLPISKVFEHNLHALNFASKDTKFELSFKNIKGANVPTQFAAQKTEEKDAPQETLDIEAVIFAPTKDSLIAVFNKDKIPALPLNETENMELSVFSSPSEAPVPMTEFKSYKNKPSSDFRKKSKVKK